MNNLSDGHESLISAYISPERPVPALKVIGNQIMHITNDAGSGESHP